VEGRAGQRAFILAEDAIGPEALPLAGAAPAGASAAAAAARGASGLGIDVGLSIAEAERRLIQATLAGCDGDKKRTAEVLGISVKTLYNRLAEYRAAEGGGHR